MFCGKCGKEVQEGARFCPVCGAALQARVVADPQKETKKGSKKWIMLVGVLLALLVVGIVIWIFWNKSEKTPEYVMTEWYTADENLFSYIEYDEDGKKTKETRCYPNAEMVIEYRFKEDGGYQRKRIYNADWTSRSEEHFENEYDRKGNLTKTTAYNEDDERQWVLEFEYRKDGILKGTKEYVIDEEGDKWLLSTSTNDENGNWKKFITYDEDGEVVERVTVKNKLDENGNLEEARFYENGEEIWAPRFYKYEKLSDYLEDKDDIDGAARRKMEEER